ncbi:uncharacterized protein LOC135956004 [Calliphora vicina]|uniref:uncharacterized protein LOC135956004 n=1 Tax=Calliphora vicina TaxID=7373 RepID=UPI00325AAFDF
MKCCSRSTLGVVIGILNVLVFTAGVILLLVAFVQVGLPDCVPIVFVLMLVASLIMIVISALLIMGIVKSRHKLMLPWLILSGISFLMEIVVYAYKCYIRFSLAGLIGSLIAIVFSALIIWLIYTLYADIRKNNISKTEQVMNASQIE